MKLLNTSVEKLHRHISVSIDFDKNLNILTGVNGSGKTNLLNLIDAVLRLDICYLDKVYFKNFILVLEHNNTDYKIEIRKTKNTFIFKVNSESIEISKDEDFHSIFNVEESIQSKFINKYHDKLFENSKAFSIFSTTTPPLMLGLNRDTTQKDDIDNKERNLTIRDGKITTSRPNIKKNHSDPITNSLKLCEKLIFEEHRNIKKYEQTQTNVLRNKIITSSFDYVSGELLSQEQMSRKLNNISHKKESIIDALQKINIEDMKMNNQIDYFFQQLHNLDSVFSSKKSETQPLTIELILNLSQIERVFNLISIIEEHKTMTDIKRNRLNLFTNTINKFLKYTNKRIIVNSTGEVIILVNEKHKVKIEYLSSGEMQLLIIISNMIFCKNQNKGMIIIVDEPEISLHIRWQEILISTLRTIQKDAQLIFATHSPDIISENESYCIPLINNEWAH